MSDEATSELAVVKQRFLVAEQELQAATAALREMQTATEQLAEGGHSLIQAAAALGKMEGGLAQGVSVLTQGTAELARSVELLELADPAKLRGDISTQAELIRGDGIETRAALEKMEAVHLESIKAEILRIEGAIQSAQETLLTATEAIGADMVALRKELKAESLRLEGAIRLVKESLLEAANKRGAELIDFRREVRILLGLAIAISVAGVVGVFWARA